jgi:hypothetical protein
MRRTAPFSILIALAACSSTSSPPAHPEPTPVAEVDAAPAEPVVPAAVASAPAWIFHYRTADRSETWTLRQAEGAAMIVVESKTGTLRYTGTAKVEAASLVLDVSTGTAKLVLACKSATRPVGRACNDTAAAPIDLLDCYHPDFATPMPFGPAPGIEYVVDASCNGYRLAAP